MKFKAFYVLFIIHFIRITGLQGTTTRGHHGLPDGGLDMWCFVRPVTEWPVGRLFAIAEEIGARFRDSEPHWAQRDLHMDVLVGAVAEGLPLRLAAQAPRVLFVCKRRGRQD